MFKTADQLTAFIIVIGCLALLFCRIDGEVKSILTIAATWLFRGAYIAKTQPKPPNE